MAAALVVSQESTALAGCRQPWLVLAGPFLTDLAQMAQKTLLSPCRGTISVSVSTF